MLVVLFWRAEGSPPERTLATDTPRFNIVSRVPRSKYGFYILNRPSLPAMSNAPPIIIPAPNPKAMQPATIIFLHGFGDDAHGWTGLCINQRKPFNILLICDYWI